MLYIATPTHSGSYCAGYVRGIVSMSSVAGTVPWGHIEIRHESSVSRARNKICSAFLTTEAPWLLMIDDDICWTHEDVRKIMEARRSVVGGAYVKKTTPREPVWEPMSDAVETAEDVIEVKSTGAGFLLIENQVLKQMAPYMRVNNEGPIWFAHEPAEDGTYRSEDQAFCDRYRALGGKVWLHRRVELGHIGLEEYR